MEPGDQIPLMNDSERGGPIEEDPPQADIMNDLPMIDNPQDEEIIIEKIKKKLKKKKRLCSYWCNKDERDNIPDDPDAVSQDSQVATRSEVNKIFRDQATFELWIIFVIKLITSLIFLIDDLTFLLYC